MSLLFSQREKTDYTLCRDVKAMRKISRIKVEGNLLNKFLQTLDMK